MGSYITVFRSADETAEEDAREILKMLSSAGIAGILVGDSAPGVPEGAWEIRVEGKDSARAESLIDATPLEDDFAIDQSRDLDMVTVFQSAGNSSEMEAMSVKALLESNGVKAMVVADARFPNLPEEVRVARENAAEAKRLIAAALAAGPAGAAEAEAETEA